MELSPKQKQQVQMKFDSYCKKTIKGEVKHYWRELTRQKSKESLFSELTRQELEQLYSMDDYCFDRRYLVNEGNQTLQMELILPTEKLIGIYDLWCGKAAKTESEKVEKRRKISLEIPERGSLLLFICSEEEYDFLPDPVSDILKISPQFILIQENEDKVQKEYQAILNISEEELSHKEIRIYFDAEEMVELTINKKFVGAEFWSPQVFER